MAPSSDRPRRPAKLSRWAASGLTAAVTVGAVGTMANAAENDVLDETGATLGLVARYQGELSAVAMMAAADPGLDEPAPIPPPRIGRADVS